MTRRTNNKKNLASERFGLQILMRDDPRMLQPTLSEKKKVLEICKLPNLYLRSFDLIKLHVGNFAEVNSLEDFTLIEVKVTRATLPNFPKGFFFGMTENEEKLLKDLGNSFLLCLLALSETGANYKFLNYDELKLLIRTKRIQYQINL
jgi:hypothetical protein